MTNSPQDHTLRIRMLNDRILAFPEPVGAERQSSSGLVIPTLKPEHSRLTWAKAVALGENVREVLPGQLVLFDPATRAEVEINGAIYVVLREKDLHGVLQAESEDEATGLYL